MQVIGHVIVDEDFNEEEPDDWTGLEEVVQAYGRSNPDAPRTLDLQPPDDQLPTAGLQGLWRRPIPSFHRLVGTSQPLQSTVQRFPDPKELQRTCGVCNVISESEKAYQDHLLSKKHTNCAMVHDDLKVMIPIMFPTLPRSATELLRKCLGEKKPFKKEFLKPFLELYGCIKLPIGHISRVRKQLQQRKSAHDRLIVAVPGFASTSGV